uniref:Uncharacterized protein n=1 Tax=Anguilla anguilla TaxID=7936 RepID=A0A0E9RLS5_ANGAN
MVSFPHFRSLYCPSVPPTPPYLTLSPSVHSSFVHSVVHRSGQ